MILHGPDHEAGNGEENKENDDDDGDGDVLFHGCSVVRRCFVGGVLFLSPLGDSKSEGFRWLGVSFSSVTEFKYEKEMKTADIKEIQRSITRHCWVSAPTFTPPSMRSTILEVKNEENDGKETIYLGYMGPNHIKESPAVTPSHAHFPFPPDGGWSC